MDGVLTGIAIATFVKDVVELGLRIQTSIEKVAQNKRRIRRLTDDILLKLYALQDLYNAHASEFESSVELSGAVQQLKRNMLAVAEDCHALLFTKEGSPRSGLRVRLSNYRKRDDIEEEIRVLRDRVLHCYATFTAFSAVRTESTALRVEQEVLVSREEHRAQLGRIDVMITQILLETPMGRHTIGGMLHTVTQDYKPDDIGVQYFKLQFAQVAEILQGMSIRLESEVIAQVQYAPANRVKFRYASDERAGTEDLVTRILRMKRDLTEKPGTVSWHDSAYSLCYFLTKLPNEMHAQKLQSGVWAVQLYRMLCLQSPRYLPFLALTITNLSSFHLQQKDYDAALSTMKDACKIWGVVVTEPDSSHGDRSGAAYSLHTLGRCFLRTGQHNEALVALSKAVAMYEDLLAHPEDGSDRLTKTHATFLQQNYQDTLNYLAETYLELKQPSDTLLTMRRCLRSMASHHTAVTARNAALQLKETLTALYRQNILKYDDITGIAEEIFNISPKHKTFRGLYISLVELLVSTDDKDIDSTGAIISSGHAKTDSRRHFEANYYGHLTSLSPRVATYFLEHQDQVRTLLLDAFESCFKQNAEAMADLDLTAIFIKHFELDACDALEQACQKYIFDVTGPEFPLAGIHQGIRVLSRWFSGTHYNSYDTTFSSRLLGLSREAVDHCREVHGQSEVMQLDFAVCLHLMSGLFQRAKDYQAASDFLKEAIGIFRHVKLDSNSKRDYIEALADRSWCLLAMDFCDESLQSAREAFHLARIAFSSSEKTAADCHLFHCDICRFIDHLVMTVFLPSLDELSGAVSDLLHIDRLPDNRVPSDVVNSLLSVVKRAHHSGMVGLVNGCFRQILRIFDKFANLQGFIDEDTIRATLRALGEACITVPTSELPSLADMELKVQAFAALPTVSRSNPLRSPIFSAPALRASGPHLEPIIPGVSLFHERLLVQFTSAVEERTKGASYLFSKHAFSVSGQQHLYVRVNCFNYSTRIPTLPILTQFCLCGYHFRNNRSFCLPQLGLYCFVQ